MPSSFSKGASSPHSSQLPFALRITQPLTLPDRLYIFVVVSTKSGFSSPMGFFGSQKIKAKNHRILFDVNTPGRCSISVEGAPKVNTIIAVDIGWGDSISRVFLGYIERVQASEKGWSELFCRELAVLLFKPLDITLRHPTLMQLLSDVTNKTGLQLVDEEDNFESKTDKDNITECSNQRIKVLEDKIEEIANNKTTTAKKIIEVADLITMNGGKGIVQGDCICAFTGKPHSDLSSTVKAGK